MKDHSTMTTFEFLLSITWKYVIGFIWYKNLLFRVLPHRDVYDSLRLLLIMMLVSVVCFIIAMNRRKNGWTATACFVLPFGLYTVLTYSTTSALFIRVVAVVLLPVGAEDGEVVILRLEANDDETESYISVEDEDVLMTVFGIFKEK